MEQTKELQGKILFKRTDIVTMKKDIKMLRELDAHKESQKVLNPATSQQAIEAEKQKAFALKSQEVKAQAELQEKNQLLAKQNQEAETLKKTLEKTTIKINHSNDDELEKTNWAAERSAMEVKKHINDVIAKNKEVAVQKAQLEQKIAQTQEALHQAELEKPQIPSTKPQTNPNNQNENERRRKFMEDIEAWANSTDKKS